AKPPRVMVAFALALTAFGPATGGVPAPPFVSGPPVPDEMIKKIERGKSTKAEILEWFGMPIAIGARGETLTRPRPTVRTGEKASGVRPEGYVRTEADTLFELFSSRHNLTDTHRIYYYYRAVSTNFAIVGPGPVFAKRSTSVRRLWVLISEDTGIVEDFVFMAGE